MVFLRFITSKVFVKQIVFAILSGILIFWLVFRLLAFYTKHGETTPVPDFAGLKIAELDGFVADKQVQYQIIDSVYDVSKSRGVVIKQDPEPNSQVKYNRTIYLYVTAVRAAQISMPQLQDRSLRQATSMLETYGLKLGKTTFVPDQCTNCILKQMIKNEEVREGTMVDKGTVINLVVGKGLGDEKVPIPFLLGLTRAQARQKLIEYSLSEGAVTYDSKTDTANARLYKQIPDYSASENMNLGAAVDLFFTTNPKKIAEILQVTENTGNDE